MNYCVPDLDVGSSEFDYPHSPNLGRGKSEAAAASPASFCDKGEEKYTSAKKKNTGVHALDNQISWMEAETEENHAHLYGVGRASALAVDVPLGQLPFQEDEMLSWLQYPLDDTFNKSYCSEQLYEPPLMLYPAQSSIPRLISRDSEKLLSTSFSSQLLDPLDSGMGTHMSTSDAAMAMGAHRAAGRLPQEGAEAFNTVHTTRQSSPNTSSSCKASDINNVEDNHAGKQNARNFSFFSQRVAAMKTSLQILGSSSGPLNKERLKQPLNTQVGEQSSSVELSTSTATLTSVSLRGDSYVSEQGRETTRASGLNVQQKFTDRSHCSHKAGKAKTEINAGSAAVGSEILESGDVTVTSLSDGSDDSTEKSAREMPDLSCKRKQSSAEEFECDSKDARGVASQGKDSVLNHSNSAKRSRAAESHNQSEKRRRNKINEKMRALQELIPNANKTDKASMLDEAIEYVKMLQAQLQMMSMRTGMVVPRVMMPPGLQYLASPHRQDPAQMNMGMGNSRGDAMDASNSSVVGLPTSAAFLVQSLPGHAYHLSGYRPNGSLLVPHEAPSSMNPNHRHSMSTFQQLQLLHPPRTGNIYKAHMRADSDTQQQH